MMYKIKYFTLLMFIVGICQSHSTAVLDSTEVSAQYGMVSSQDEYASEVGLNILKQGGNAVDAAIAVAYTLAVTHPRAGNIGGGGFMLIYDQDTKKVSTIDFREKAPLKAYKELFIDQDGHVDNTKARFSIFSAGVPGTVAGLEAVYNKFGTLPREILLRDAINFAKNGFKIDSDQYDVLKKKVDILTQDKYFRRLFYDKKKSGYEPKEIIVQKHLATTLDSIKEHGQKGFYEGDVAKHFANYFRKKKGLITQTDLKRYQPVWREPVIGRYKNRYDIFSMPPPSSGGIALIQLLNILESKDIETLEHNSADYIHTIVEAMKYVYADRAAYLGDEDFVDVPVSKLISKSYADTIANSISTKNIIAVDSLHPELLDTSESMETTHFSVIDKNGNMVSCTYTLNFAFGNGMIAGKTGIILNNEMDDFVAKPGSPNGFGLLGNEKNEIAPEKRMLSSMTPTLVFKDSKPLLITGSPGGSTIITSVFQTIFNVIEHEMGIGQASSEARFHHQWYPDMIVMEDHHNEETVQELEKRGYKIKRNSLGITQSILLNKNKLTGKSDPRNISSSTTGY